jgi:hypothetical protein
MNENEKNQKRKQTRMIQNRANHTSFIVIGSEFVVEYTHLGRSTLHQATLAKAFVR